jgi:UPF0176 protein
MSQHNIIVATFYKFTTIEQPNELRETLYDLCAENGILGTILLATEGINGTIAASREGIDAVLAYLRSLPAFTDLEHKEAVHETMPFRKLKVKVKKEIVTMGIPDINPPKEAGIYVTPDEWNRLISDPEVIVIDTRNDYEYRVGTFQRAINPKTGHFREFPKFVDQQLDPHKHQKVAMFCTGGIRCEKATAYLRRKGFREVYHLKGGILKYLENVPAEQSLWNGECFVFDERVTVDHHLKRGHYVFCNGCGEPIPLADQNNEKIQYCASCKEKGKQC